VLEKNREALVSIGVSLDAALLEAINKQLQDMCGFVCENILGKMVDIMMVLPFESLCSSAWDVRKLIDCCMDLIDAGESSSKKTFYTVRSQLLSQVKSYLQVNHESGMQKLQSSLESEAWEEVSIPKKYQKLVDKGFITLMFGSNNSLNSPSAAEIVDKLSTPALSEFSALQKLNALKSFWWDSPELDNYSKNSVSSPLASHKKSDVSSEGAMYIIVDDEKFKLTSTMLKLFDYITFYIECAILLDYIAPDSLSRLVQFLSLYNSRSRQLILGVIGMQAASIKPQISSKQITMSSQCLGVLISAIPLLVKALKEKLPLKHHRSLQDFDRILKEISDHRDELFNKLRPPPPPPPPPSIPKK
jgi:CRISPR/Cas system type I-B associated protein Csh2 (Cas7 group RAMP superfamily)